jgi:hypothetical protein
LRGIIVITLEAACRCIQNIETCAAWAWCHIFTTTARRNFSGSICQSFADAFDFFFISEIIDFNVEFARFGVKGFVQPIAEAQARATSRNPRGFARVRSAVNCMPGH